MSTIYSAIDEAIYHEIIEPLENSCEVADARAQFDVEAIANETIEYRAKHNADGVQLANRSGFMRVVDDAKFWDIVAAHDLGA